MEPPQQQEAATKTTSEEARIPRGCRAAGKRGPVDEEDKAQPLLIIGVPYIENLLRRMGRDAPSRAEDQAALAIQVATQAMFNSLLRNAWKMAEHRANRESQPPSPVEVTLTEMDVAQAMRMSRCFTNLDALRAVNEEECKQ